jgi:hypothetical protein
MKIFKLTVFGFLIGLGLTTSSCKKAVIEHELNYPHTAMDVQEYTVGANDWVGDANGYAAEVTSSLMTSELLTDGIVMCYIKEGSEYLAMPITRSYGAYISHWGFSHSSNSITFWNYDDDGATITPGDQTFKIAVFSQAGLIAHPDVDILDYESVEKAFNL